MKTAEQLIDEATNYGGKSQTKNDLIRLLEEYAQQVAEHTIQDCANNALAALEKNDNPIVAILSTKIKLP